MEESSSDTSSGVISPPKQDKKRAPTSQLDTSLNNPTPAMLAILERMRTKQSSPPAQSSKKKHPRYTRYTRNIHIYFLFKKN